MADQADKKSLPEAGIKRRGLLRFGTILTAITGASAVSSLAAGSAQAAPGDKNPPNTYVPLAEKGVPSGVATLDSGSKIPVVQVPDLSTTYWPRTSDAIRITKEEVAGLTDVVPVLRAASDFAVANGIHRIYLPPVTMEYRSRWYLNVGPDRGLEIIGHGEHTIFKHTGGTPNLAFIHALGTDGAKVAVTADIPAGSTSAVFPSAVASTLTVGSCVGFESSLVVFDVNNEAGMATHASEIRKVAAVAGDTVTFDGPTIWPYNVAQAAVVWKMNPVNGIKLRDFVITSSDPLINKWKGIQIAKATNVEISGITFRDAGGGLFLYDVLDAVVSNVSADRLPNYTSFLGYGVCIAGRSANILVQNLRGRGTRHVFTTLSDERNGILWGGPRHITVRGGVGEAHPGSFSVWDTHPQAYDVTFENCHASGGVAGSGDSCGFQIRGHKVQIINGVARNMGAGGLRHHTMAENLEVNGGEFAYSKTFGLALNANARISGAWVHHNGASGIVLGARSLKVQIVNSRIEDNAQVSSGYGIHDQSKGDQSGIVLGPGNIIPKGVSQVISVMSPKNDVVIYGNVLRGYGAGSDGVGGTPGIGVFRGQNITD